ncbi:MAG: hypothetical protein Q8P22_05160 [Chloroflexota bacterium]|nr:hypothetical protein [Chloroflexota bacterium]
MAINVHRHLFATDVRLIGRLQAAHAYAEEAMRVALSAECMKVCIKP